MKPVIILLSLLYCNVLLAQNNHLLELVFADSSNFSIAESDGKRPSKYLVLSNTQEWNGTRFKLKENVRLDSVRKKLERNEHHPYNHSYLFKDTLFSKLFSDEEKEQLFLQASTKPITNILNPIKNVSLIQSFSLAEKGFFFSVSTPIFTSNNQFAFVDITVYLKNDATRELKSACFGTVCVAYRQVDRKGWRRIAKKEHLIL